MRLIDFARDVRRHPLLVKEIARQFTGSAAPPPDRAKIEQVADWLLRAQKPDGGYAHSLSYQYPNRWLSSYPETTGYIIPTLLDAARLLGNDKYIVSATRAAAWLETQVTAEGFVLGGLTEQRFGPEVFDTAQILEGFLSLIPRQPSYLALSVKIADWIVAQQDDDGAFRRSSLHGLPHSYYTRAAMHLATIARVTGQARYADAAWKNAVWALGNFRPDDSIDLAFFETDPKYTYSHLTAYTIEGLLAISSTLDRELPGNDKIVRHLDRIIGYNRDAKRIPGIMAPGWQNDPGFECVTGSAQYAICLALRTRMTGDPAHLGHGRAILDRLGKMIVWDPRSELGGAVPGSWPLWGRYHKWTYLNWAAKFYLDALIACYPT